MTNKMIFTNETKNQVFNWLSNHGSADFENGIPILLVRIQGVSGWDNAEKQYQVARFGDTIIKLGAGNYKVVPNNHENLA